MPTCLPKFAAIALVSALFVGVAEADADAVTAAKTYYARQVALYKTKDAAGLKKLILATTTPDFTTTVGAPNGKLLSIPRDQMISVLAGTFPKVQTINLTIGAVTPVTVTKTMSVLDVTVATNVLTVKGQDGKSHKLDVTTKKEETWIKVGGAWKLKSTRQLSASRLIDGHSQVGRQR